MSAEETPYRRQGKQSSKNTRSIDPDYYVRGFDHRVGRLTFCQFQLVGGFVGDGRSDDRPSNVYKYVRRRLTLLHLGDRPLQNIACAKFHEGLRSVLGAAERPEARSSRSPFEAPNCHRPTDHDEPLVHADLGSSCGYISSYTAAPFLQATVAAFTWHGIQVNKRRFALSRWSNRAQHDTALVDTHRMSSPGLNGRSRPRSALTGQARQ